MEPRIIIAIDGVVGGGKGTLACLLAKKLGYIHIDSGAMYRAVTLYLIQNNIPIEDTDAIIAAIPHIEIDFRLNHETGDNETWLNGENVEPFIRGQDISTLVPFVSQVMQVRHLVNKKQLELGAERGVVAEGRDIGTAVFPDAELKIFLSADAEVRAKRRYKELVDKGHRVELPDVLQTIQNRDKADMERALNPLRKADGAIEIDSTSMTIEQVVDRGYELAQEAIAKL